MNSEQQQPVIVKQSPSAVEPKAGDLAARNVTAEQPILARKSPVSVESQATKTTSEVLTERPITANKGPIVVESQVGELATTRVNSVQEIPTAQITTVEPQKDLVKMAKYEALSTNRNESDISEDFLISVQKQGSSAEDNSTKDGFTGKNKEKGQFPINPSKVEAVKGDDLLLSDSKANATDFASIMAKEKTQSVTMAEGKNVAAPSVWEQVTNEMQRLFIAKRQEVKELEISLHPADLGKIKIALRWENGQVHLQCQASETTTAGILQQNFAQLRESLQSIGISCGMLQMGFGGQQQHQHKNELNFTNRRGEPENEEEEGQGRRIFNTNGNSGDHIVNIKV